VTSSPLISTSWLMYSRCCPIGSIELISSLAIERLEQQLGEEVVKRFPGSAVQRATVLQYGDEPMIEPGELLVRLILEAPEGQKGQEQALHAFEEGHEEAFKQFRKDLSAALPNVWRLEILTSTDAGDGPGWCWAADAWTRWRPGWPKAAS
jgi:hypothetical protein